MGEVRGGGDKMFGHPPLYPPEVWRVDPLPLREGTLTLDTLQLAAGWFIEETTPSFMP